MKIFRVSGFNKKTGCYEAANVMASNHEQAVKLMAMSHVCVECCDKRGVE
jgi:sulfur relay (sulfurtransferase) complex TusBCD TusD component (DsrE family)